VRDDTFGSLLKNKEPKPLVHLSAPVPSVVLPNAEVIEICEKVKADYNKVLQERTIVTSGGTLNKQNFVDMTSWPEVYPNAEDAVEAYNRLGEKLGVMLKIEQSSCTNKFTLVCIYAKAHNKSKINQMDLIKKVKQYQCPVHVTFRQWGSLYKRSECLTQQHNHALTIEEKWYLRRPEIQAEIKLYVQSGLNQSLIVNCVNRKFNLSIPYSNFGAAVKAARNELHDYIDFNLTQTEQLMQMLRKMQLDNSSMKYKVQMQEGAVPEQIEVLLIQTPVMASNYAHFSDVVFMDSTYNTNQLGHALAVVNGINGEGKNIILAFALMARETAENYIWLLQSLVDLNGGVEPVAIMTDFDASMCQAIETVYSKTTHLLCQWHMMQNLKKHFVYLSKRRSACSKLLYNHIIDAIYCDQQDRFTELQDLIFQ
jgi:hypothetical protein